MTIGAQFEAALSNRYRIERELGRGGMATVYLAEDLRYNRRVALKVLEPTTAEALGSERFLREIALVARLRHPHILPLLDSGEVGGVLYYVMPYLEEGSVRGRLEREGRLPLPLVLRIGREVADALDYAHTQGVVHRDIKPENILLEGRHVVVADFGVARALRAASATNPTQGNLTQASLTQAGLIVGTPLYMSPEQACGDETLDGRSDLYSLGCVLSSSPPASLRSRGEPTRGVQPAADEYAPTLAARGVAVPPAIEAVFQRALARRPEARHQTAGELAEALEAAEHADSGAHDTGVLEGASAPLPSDTNAPNNRAKAKPISLTNEKLLSEAQCL